MHAPWSVQEAVRTGSFTDFERSKRISASTALGIGIGFRVLGFRGLGFKGLGLYLCHQAKLLRLRFLEKLAEVPGVPWQDWAGSVIYPTQ